MSVQGGVAAVRRGVPAAGVAGDAGAAGAGRDGGAGGDAAADADPGLAAQVMMVLHYILKSNTYCHLAVKYIAYPARQMAYYCLIHFCLILFSRKYSLYLSFSANTLNNHFDSAMSGDYWFKI